MSFLLGIDGGGTKTTAVIADRNGRILGFSTAGGSNYQVSGEGGAIEALQAAIEGALSTSNVTIEEIAAAGLGLAGVDGPKERAIVERIVARSVPVKQRFLENDSLLVLRAATKSGVGVGLVAGTGQNCIARDREGQRLQIGGMGAISGDAGYSADLAFRTVMAAWRASDGRAPRSILTEEVAKALNLPFIEGAVDLASSGRFEDQDIRKILPVLFSAERNGDVLARRIIEDVAQVLSDAAHAALQGLSLQGEDRVVILGGAMLQLDDHRALADAVRDAIQRRDPSVRVERLTVPPVIGALLWARDLLGGDACVFAERVLSQAVALKN